MSCVCVYIRIIADDLLEVYPNLVHNVIMPMGTLALQMPREGLIASLSPRRAPLNSYYWRGEEHFVFVRAMCVYFASLVPRRALASFVPKGAIL